MSTFFCPTPKLTVKRSLILILHKIENVKNLNWAKFVLEFLVEGVQKFKEDKSVGVNGCVMLLMVMSSNLLHRSEEHTSELQSP